MVDYCNVFSGSMLCSESMRHTAPPWSLQKKKPLFQKEVAHRRKMAVSGWSLRHGNDEGNASHALSLRIINHHKEPQPKGCYCCTPLVHQDMRPKDDHPKDFKEDPSRISPIVQSNSPQIKDGTVLVSVFAGVAWAL